MTQHSPTIDQDKADRVIETLGGKEAVLAALADFDQVLRRFDSEEASLTEQFPNKWIAVGKNGFEEVGESIEEVLAACKARGLRNPDIVVRYLDPDPPTFIL